MVHDILKKIWDQLKTQLALIEASDMDIQSLVTKTIQSVLSKNLMDCDYPAVLMTLEKKFLNSLITQWLDLEKKRSPFKISHTEPIKPITIEFAGLTFSIKADRLDREETDQTYTLIDYKTTAAVSPYQWTEERPDEPQLPLYLVTTQNPISTVAFGIITSKKCEFRYMSAKKFALPGRNYLQDTSVAGWENQRHEWKLHLEKLAKDFQQGIAEVSPKKGLETCRYCHLQTFCRIYTIER